MIENFKVPMPDEVDIWVHNHNMLNRVSWLMIALAGLGYYRGYYFAVVVCAALVVTLRSMSRLLCGWVHAWVALSVEVSNKRDWHRT